MDFHQIRSLLDSDLKAIDRCILDELHSDVVLVNQIGHYIIQSGGKRVRPLLVALCAKACGYQGSHHVPLAAIVEFIHTATLLHDDVVDESTMRRGKATANAEFGNQASVLVGDFLYSRAFQMMVNIDSMRVMRILADATNVIAEGEVLQLMNCNDPDTTEAQYMEVIHYKTAKLFQAAGQLGAVISGRDEQTIQALGEYGMRVGTAFQLVDDILDYKASADEMGKNVGDDLAEGKPTLPLIHVMRQGSPEQISRVRDAITHGGADQLELILESIVQTGALEYTQRIAIKEVELAKAAIAPIDDSPYKQAMLSLADFIIQRTY
jgi:octaprenyl-diphosphate synthase